MMRLALSATVMFLLSASVLADENIPFAVAPELRPSNNNAYVPSLSEIMQIVQLKHMKLWQAGAAHNWQLSTFEVEQIRDTFLRTAIFYQDVPADLVVAVEPPLMAMKKASAAGDVIGYNDGYARLTVACNACHQAASVGFIVIKVPTSSPFSDQEF